MYVLQASSNIERLADIAHPKKTTGSRTVCVWSISMRDLQRGIALVPLRTLAADIGHIKYKKVDPKWKGNGGLVPPGTHVYIKEYDGLRLPDGTIHDGWLVVNDTGGGIFGAHFDLFVGTLALLKGREVKLPEFGQVWYEGIEQRIPPGYTYGLKP
jgi:hypothetical protein